MGVQYYGTCRRLCVWCGRKGAVAHDQVIGGNVALHLRSDALEALAHMSNTLDAFAAAVQ
jgi:hypothetical protein